MSALSNPNTVLEVLARVTEWENERLTYQKRSTLFLLTNNMTAYIEISMDSTKLIDLVSEFGEFEGHKANRQK